MNEEIERENKTISTVYDEFEEMEVKGHTCTRRKDQQIVDEQDEAGFGYL